jgi:anti-sigma regulatory factor (Ser/Thr protein kinase)
VLDFVKERGRALGWRGEELSKLQLAVEEAFLYQIDDFGDLAGQTTRVSMRGDSQTLSIELACAQGNDNIEARLQDLPEAPVEYSEEDLRLRILKSFCDDIEHQQFHGGDYLSMTLTAAPDSAISGIA